VTIRDDCVNHATARVPDRRSVTKASLDELRAPLQGNHMPYLDGFVLPVPKHNLEAYRTMATVSETVWREYGALDYKEWVADDVKPGEYTSFPQSVQLKDDEVVVFSYIVFESRAQRDEINEKVMQDPRITAFGDPKDAPFDSKRMIFGGFTLFVGS
jgi:uncharacterized protein YbaA (DUF1428 family)